jgi:hypothetical protein
VVPQVKRRVAGPEWPLPDPGHGVDVLTQQLLCPLNTETWDLAPIS